MRIELASFRISQILLQIPYLREGLAAFQTKWFFDRQIRSISGSWDALPADEIEIMYESLLHNNGNFRLPSTISYLSDRYRFQNSRWIPALQQLAQSGLKINLCWGSNDAVAPFAIALRLSKDIPEANLKVLEGIGHFSMIETPQQWSKTILSLY